MEKPRLIDRLLMICLCLDLALAFWCLSISFDYQDHILTVIS
jgi:hypothetical protein